MCLVVNRLKLSDFPVVDCGLRCSRSYAIPGTHMPQIFTDFMICCVHISCYICVQRVGSCWSHHVARKVAGLLSLGITS